MAAIITSRLKIRQAKFYKNSVSDALTNLYLFIGKSDPWANDTEPPISIDDIIQESERWNNMISLKKVSDVSLGVRKFLWDTTGDTIYIQYSDDDVDLFNHPTQDEIDTAGSGYTAGSFYVMTDNFDVYKCISNGGGVKSTEKPTGTTISIIETTADGYKWKYMFTIPTSEAKKYETPDFIPLKTLVADDGSNQWDVQVAAIDGAVEQIKVLTPGSGYVDVDESTAQNGGGANTIILQAGASAVNDIFNGATIFIDDGQNAGQYKTIIDYDGASKMATVDSNWVASIPPNDTSDYVITATATVAGGSGANLEARVYLDTGVVDKIEPVNVGSGYKFSDGLTITISGAGGTGATARAIISPKGGHGKDPVDELGGFYSITNVILNYNETDFITQNDYRIIGLASDIVNFGTSTISTAITLSATKALDCTTLVDSFDEDETIVGGTSGAVAVIIESTEDSGAATADIRYYQNSTTGFVPFQAAEAVTGQVSGATAVIGTLNNPEMEPYEGDIVHVEQRRPLMRSEDQLEDIKIVIQH